MAFKVFPARVVEVMKAHGWFSFVDFMGDIARRVRMTLPDAARTDIKVLQKANTEAMRAILAEAFAFGDVKSVRRALKEVYEIDLWHHFAQTVLEIALALFSEYTRGKSPLDFAKRPTLLFYHLRPNSPLEVLEEIVEAFGLATPRHLEAITNTFYAGELTIEDLDRAVEAPDVLTERVNRLPSNPYPVIIFGFPQKGIDENTNSGNGGPAFLGEVHKDDVRLWWSGSPLKSLGTLDLETNKGRIRAVFGIPELLSRHLLAEGWSGLAQRVFDIPGGLVAYLTRVSVIPWERGRGIGTDLLRDALERLRGFGVRTVFLHVIPTEPERLSDLVRFYKRLGFQEDPCCPEDVHQVMLLSL
jgi:GNAT superfamily N-acetyltransferase